MPPFSLQIYIIYLVLMVANFSIIDTDGRRMKTRPHIVVIMADDMGWNDVSYHGSDQIPTPNIDALAYNGLILTNHYVLPVCTPSRTAFFTGRYPIRTGMQGTPLRPGEARGLPLQTKLLPEYLRELGYSTHLIGKWHLGYETDGHTPTRRGFDTFFGYYSGYITYFSHTITEANQTGYDIHRDTSEKLQPDYTGFNKYATDVFTDEAIRIIRKHKDNQSLYLQINHLAPHASDDLTETLETRNFTEINRTFSYIKDINRRKYAGMMTVLDDSIGLIMQALSNKGILNNSIILFMSDNGAKTIGMYANHGSNYPLRGIKGSLYEGAVHGVACIYSTLIKQPHRIVNDLIHITDWLPTLYAASGGDVSDLIMIDGLNQWPTISSMRHGSRSSFLVNIDENVPIASAVHGSYKLIIGNTGKFNDYYGSAAQDNDPEAPTYNLTAVMTSPASLAIYQTTKTLVAPELMLELRSANKITCQSPEQFSTCLDYCLFDLRNDPCETTDISNQHLDIVNELGGYINGFADQLIAQINVTVDPHSFPQNFNNTWMPWINDASDEIEYADAM